MGFTSNPPPAGMPLEASAGDELETYSDAIVGTTSATYVKAKEIRVGRAGTYRIKFNLYHSVGGGGNDAFGRIYRNGVAVGAERTTDLIGGVTFSEDIASWAVNDLCQLYHKESGSGTAAVKEFRVYSVERIDHEVIT